MLGLTGLTAYFGLLEVGQPKQGDTVVISGAAGATGSVVGQIARLKGCRAVGIAGGAEKCAWLTEKAGFDAAIDYKSEDVGARLSELCPDGIDVFFDNVGGEILDEALARIARGARIVICGSISRYNRKELPPGPRNYYNIVMKRGTMERLRDHGLPGPRRRGHPGAGRLGDRRQHRLGGRRAAGFENAPKTLCAACTRARTSASSCSEL